MKILGISLGHDTNFSLIIDGKVFAVMEPERYFRSKRYKLHCITLEPGKHPSGFQYVALEDLELFLSFIHRDWGKEYDALAVQNQKKKGEYKNLLKILDHLGFKFKSKHHLNHHLCHASSAFYTSPFREAVVLSFDGSGNDGKTILFQADGKKGIDYFKNDPVCFGQCYNNMGFIAGIRPEVCGTTAGKAMGLAAYGKIRGDWLDSARKYVRLYSKIPQDPVEGLSNFGKGHLINSVGLNEIAEFKPFLTETNGLRLTDFLRFIKNSPKISEMKLGQPTDSIVQDMVATVQSAWTKETLGVLKGASHLSKNLCVVGGCALNGVTNYEILQSGMFESVHFVPNASDCGLSAGAGLYVYYRLSEKSYHGYDGHFSPFLGSEPFDLDELPELNKRYPSKEFSAEQTPKILARLIGRDYIVGVIRGRYEVGPRALGNRSILCNPFNKDMRDILNRKIKKREWYRPFAPVAAAEESSKYFTNTVDIPYMSVICYTRPEYRGKLPSVTHVDGSARLQTVRRSQNPFLYDSLKAFEGISGAPVFLNTSFNPKGEPILNYCSAGLKMLEDTDLDFVLIKDTFYVRPGREDLLKNLDKVPTT